MFSIRATASLSLLSAITICNAQLSLSPPGHGPHLNGTLPECAITCAETASTAVGCSITILDPACLCKQQNFKLATLQCTEKSCPFADQSTVSQVLDTLCDSTSTTITIGTVTGTGSTVTPTASTSNRTSTDASSTIGTTSVPVTTTSLSSTESTITTASTSLSGGLTTTFTSLSTPVTILTPIPTLSTPLLSGPPLNTPGGGSTTLVVTTQTSPSAPQPTVTNSGARKGVWIPGQFAQLSFIAMCMWTSTMRLL